VLALPLLALGLRGSMSAQDVVARLPWCLLAGWGAVALLRWAAQPRPTPRKPDTAAKDPTAAP
jgi:hypothetical protein